MTTHPKNLYGDFRDVSSPDGHVAGTGRPGVYRNLGKRMLDVVLVLAAGLVVLPVVLLLSILVMRDGHSPFYWSRRVGRNGRIFGMMKLRTMRPDADTYLGTYLAQNPAAAEEWHTTQKLKDDPRITPVGRFMRKTSIDELPQLWNVLKGDMSLVGPRPMMPPQRALYPGLAYYSMRPGITGPWQVSDRNECAFAMRASYDRDYEQAMSLTTDLHLMLRTVGVVAKGTGY